MPYIDGAICAPAKSARVGALTLDDNHTGCAVHHTVALSHYRLGDTLGAAFASGLARLAEQVSIKKLLVEKHA